MSKHMREGMHVQYRSVDWWVPVWVPVALTAAWGVLFLALAVYLGMHGA